MTVEYEAIAVGAFLFVAILTWNEIRIWNRMRALEPRLEIIQKEVNALEMQESRLQESRRMMVEANAHSKVEAPKVVSNDTPQSREKLPRVAPLPFVVGLPPVEALDTPPNHGSAEPKMPTLLLRRSSTAFSGTKTFLIGGAIAAALAYIFVFESSPPEIDEALAPVIASTDIQAVTPVPAPPPHALPPTIEAQGIPARTGAEREVQAPSLQPMPDLESRPNESKADITALQPTPDLQSRQSESKTTDDKSNAVPDMRPVSEHLSEQDINGDYATALRLLRPLAERGNREAEYNLAVMYANGWGGPRDERNPTAGTARRPSRETLPRSLVGQELSDVPPGNSQCSCDPYLLLAALQESASGPTRKRRPPARRVRLLR
jgi:hypothetical protein